MIETRLRHWAQLVASIELIIGVAVVVVSLVNPPGLTAIVVGTDPQSPTVAAAAGPAEVMTPGSYARDYRVGDVSGLRQLGALAGPEC